MPISMEIHNKEEQSENVVSIYFLFFVTEELWPRKVDVCLVKYCSVETVTDLNTLARNFNLHAKLRKRKL